jgi:predicted nuclease of predicted toxin-antitoxin system
LKFKLDENLDARFASILVDAGHDCDSVQAEGLGGKSDEELVTVCAGEERVLITLDLDFADPIRFPPAKAAGTIVLRPQRNTLAMIRETLASVVPMLERERLHGVLWIVEPGRLRINRPPDEDEEC